MNVWSFFLVRKIRVFFSLYSEEKFLNKNGKKGLLLRKVYPFVYFFDETETVWSYSMEWLNSSPETPENKEYLEVRKEKEGVVYCGRRNCFAFLAKEGATPPEKSPAAVKALKKRYFSLAIFWTICLVYVAGLVLYNLSWAGKFNKMGYKVPADKDEIMPYFNFVVGKNPAKLFLAFLWPIAAAVAAATVFYWTEFTAWFKKAGRLTNTGLTEENNEEPEL